MATEQRGAAHWIDHFVVGTNDIGRWVEWAIDVIGVERHPIGGLTTEARNAGRPVASFMYMGDGSCHFGAFLQREQLPPSKGLGASTPRHGFYVRAADVEAHVRRLDAHGVPHTAPARTSAEGETGVAVHFEDPDGNQYEFWAPDDLPEGAMAVETSAGVGRISSIASEISISPGVSWANTANSPGGAQLITRNSPVDMSHHATAHCPSARPKATR